MGFRAGFQPAERSREMSNEGKGWQMVLNRQICSCAKTSSSMPALPSAPREQS